MNNFDLVFWPACVRLKPFSDHVKAAAAGKFDSLSVSYDVIQDVIATGLSLRDMRTIAEDASIMLSHFESLTDWAPIRLAPDANADVRKRYDISVDHALDICGELGVGTMTVVGGYPPGTIPLDQLVEGFGNFCDRAQAQDIWVDLEFMPFFGVLDLAAAWAIVGGASRPNSGILVDVWHFTRSQSTLELLQSIPGQHLRSIQLSDGYLETRGADVLDDTIFYRAFPGEGTMPAAGVMAAMIAKGHLVNIGSEVFSHEANAMSAEEAGRRSGETTWRIMSQFEETRAAAEALKKRLQQ